MDRDEGETLAEQRRTGWVRAHVRIGASYPLISVRYGSRLGVGDPGSQLQRPISDATEIARYALALAQALAADGKTLLTLEVDATQHLLASGAPSSVALRVAGEGPGLDQAAFAAMAATVLAASRARGELPQNAEVTVHPALLAGGIGARVPSRPRLSWGSGRGRPIRLWVPRLPWGSGRGRRIRLPRVPPPRRSAFRLPKLRLGGPGGQNRGAATGSIAAPVGRAEPDSARQTAGIRPERARGRRWRAARRLLPKKSVLAAAGLLAALAIGLFWNGTLLDRANIGVLRSARVQPTATEPTLAAEALPTEPTDLAATPSAVSTAVVAATAAAAGGSAALAAAAASTAVPTGPGGESAGSGVQVAGAVATTVPAASEPAVPTPTADTSAAGSRVIMDVVPRPGAAAWPDDPTSTAWFADAGYHLFARQLQQFVAVGVLPPDEQLRDVLVSATFHKIGGQAGGGYGIIVRDQGPPPRDGLNQGGRYYVFEVGDLGQVGIWRREQDRWDEILPWTASPAVHPGTADNALSVRTSGTQLSLSVNGTDVATRTDSALSHGSVGVFLGGDQNQAVLTELRIQSNN